MRSKPMILSALLLTFGSLSDRFGRKGMLLAGLVVFGAASLAGDIMADVASLAHADLLELRVEFFPYQPCVARVWELRENVSCYDVLR